MTNNLTLQPSFVSSSLWCIMAKKQKQNLIKNITNKNKKQNTGHEQLRNQHVGTLSDPNIFYTLLETIISGYSLLNHTVLNKLKSILINLLEYLLC